MRVLRYVVPKMSHMLLLWGRLLLGGDIETNPGPAQDQIASALKEIAADIKFIKEKRLVDIDKKLDALSRLEEKVSLCQDELVSMKRAYELLERKVDDLENRSRRSNLIVYGLPEVDGETSEILEQAVNKTIVQDTLGLERVSIERIHRLGRAERNKNRPVIFKLLDFRQKSSILKSGYKLKNTSFSIGEDFSPRIRDIRRKLWNSAKENREKKEKVSLVFDKLFINNQAFTWDEEKNDKVLAQKKDEVRSRPQTRQARLHAKSKP